MIRAEIQLTPADYRSYQKSFQNYIREKARSLLGGFRINLITWGRLVLLFMLIFQHWNEIDVLTALLAGSVAIAFIGIFILELFKLNRATYPKSNSWFYEPMSYQFDESGIQC